MYTGFGDLRAAIAVWEGPPSPGFAQVFILKIVKVLCFDTLLQVFILKGDTET